MDDGASVAVRFTAAWVFYPGDRVPVDFSAGAISAGALISPPPVFSGQVVVATDGIGRLAFGPPVLAGFGVAVIAAEGAWAPPPSVLAGEADQWLRLAAPPLAAAWQSAARCGTRNVGAWQCGAPRSGTHAGVWRRSAPRAEAHTGAWRRSAPFQGHHQAAWRVGSPLQAEQGAAWRHGPSAHSLYICQWIDRTPALSAEHDARYARLPLHAATWISRWRPGFARLVILRRAWQPGRLAQAMHRGRWDRGRLDMQWPPIIIIPPQPPAPGRPLDDGARIAVPFVGGWIFIPGNRIPIPFGLDIEPPHFGSIIVLVPTVTVVRLPDRRVLEPTRLSLDLSLDKSSWEATLAIVREDDYDAIRAPDTEIEITLQGYTWRLVVVSIQASRAFAT